MDLHRLTKAEGPWLHLAVASPAELSNAVRGLERTRSVAARVVRGRKAANVAALYDESSAALQFPLYFGENWDAFRDCLLDLAWLEAKGCVLVVADAVHLLEKSPPDDLARFVRILTDAVHHWNQPAKPGKPWPFHVVLHAAAADEAALKARCQKAGISLDRLA